ncbi:hypothetical protein QTI69_14925 [Clostridium perfringens]|uniref:hypothetical protein n=1 Tax=Clostridium perfringens TaxID=1502 RepID=UPI001A21F385|nr:hypothetical protein [Clostridium perfringens]MDK0692429.1 hypothetical protein [Clostridium perfringens]MDM0892256.1 hypothetical protein [Clostridium perfringens]UBK85070.1 hypothetical protein KLF40_08615 [Clostridium perfringens]HAT4146749.1 hypothetical protein [Clostridium perfringens]
MMYELCKMQIKNGCDKEYMMSCLGCFLMTKQITQEQYMELMAMLNPVPVSPLPVGQGTNPVVTPAETAPIQPQA